MSQQKLAKPERALLRPIPKGTIHLAEVAIYIAARFHGRHIRCPVQFYRNTETGALVTVPSHEEMRERSKLFRTYQGLLLHWLKAGDLEVLIGNTGQSLRAGFWCLADPEIISAGVYDDELLVIDRTALDAWLETLKLGEPRAAADGNGQAPQQEEEAEAEPAPIQTLHAAKNACRDMLVERMRADPDAAPRKADVWAEMHQRFPTLGKATFDNAWADAVETSGAHKWRRGGRKS